MVSSGARLRVVVGFVETENKTAVAAYGVINLQTQRQVCEDVV
jgi:hypothetical protein